MIGRIAGTLLEKNPPEVLVEAGGVGYEIDVPMSTFYNLPALGERVTLLTHLVVREDAQQLFGFLTAAERHAFRQLIRISGVGSRTALAVLSGMSVGELAQAVTLQEAGRLTRIPGIGKKTAERLIIELRDRLKGVVAAPASTGGATTAVPESPVEDAVSALVGLGYKPQEASRMVRAIDTAALSSEDIIRAALQATVR